MRQDGRQDRRQEKDKTREADTASQPGGHIKKALRTPIGNCLGKKHQVIQFVTSLSLSWRSPTTFEGVTFSPSQKGHSLFVSHRNLKPPFQGLRGFIPACQFSTPVKFHFFLNVPLDINLASIHCFQECLKDQFRLPLANFVPRVRWGILSVSSRFITMCHQPRISLILRVRSPSYFHPVHMAKTKRAFCVSSMDSLDHSPVGLFKDRKSTYYPSSHNHGSGTWPPWRLKSSSRPPFSTSMIMGGRVTLCSRL